jgi:hypothetical protein
MARFPQDFSPAEFLRGFGFLGAAGEALNPELSKAVTTFQRTCAGRLKVDGILGPETERAMRLPRCGVKENILGVRGGVVKWRKDFTKEPLTWSVTSWDDALAPNVVESLFQRAWEAWVRICGIRVARTNDIHAANVRIGFGHIDGPGRTLAWAELPIGGGGPLEVRFDLGEIFSLAPGANGEVALLNVACHEFGHILGLDHIHDARALMNPIYDDDVSSPLPSDVSEAQRRYGPALTSSTPDVNPLPQPNGVPMKLLEILKALVAFSRTDLGKQLIALLMGLIKPAPTPDAALNADPTAGWTEELRRIESACQNAGLIQDAA